MGGSTGVWGPMKFLIRAGIEGWVKHSPTYRWVLGGGGATREARRPSSMGFQSSEVAPGLSIINTDFENVKEVGTPALSAATVGHGMMRGTSVSPNAFTSRWPSASA